MQSMVCTELQNTVNHELLMMNEMAVRNMQELHNSCRINNTQRKCILVCLYNWKLSNSCANQINSEEYSSRRQYFLSQAKYLLVCRNQEHYHVHTSLPLVPNPSHITPILIFPTHLDSIFILPFPLRLGLLHISQIQPCITHYPNVS